MENNLLVCQYNPVVPKVTCNDDMFWLRAKRFNLVLPPPFVYVCVCTCGMGWDDGQCKRQLGDGWGGSLNFLDTYIISEII